MFPHNQSSCFLKIKVKQYKFLNYSDYMQTLHKKHANSPRDR